MSQWRTAQVGVGRSLALVLALAGADTRKLAPTRAKIACSPIAAYTWTPQVMPRPNLARPLQPYQGHTALDLSRPDTAFGHWDLAGKDGARRIPRQRSLPYGGRTGIPGYVGGAKAGS